jgi:hypothetical protein
MNREMFNIILEESGEVLEQKVLYCSSLIVKTISGQDISPLLSFF